jgi:hypothetical protein
MKINKCYKCGGKMEKLYSCWTCVRCHTKLTVNEIAEAYEKRIEEIKSILLSQPESEEVRAALQKLQITAGLCKPFFWETKGEPEPLFNEDGSFNHYDPGEEARYDDCNLDNSGS